MRDFTWLFTASVGMSSICFANPLYTRDNGTTMIYDFAELTPSPELAWQPCYDNFTCTLLEVPLDYTDPSIGTTVIAFIKKSSQNEAAEDILINPGGPGGSGVDIVLNGIEPLEAKLGTDHNLVGFDPRGVNNSGPSVSCFPDNPIAKNLFYADVFTPIDNSSEAALQRGFNKAGAFGEWCSAIHAVNGTAKYANTVAVAQDMLHYIELKAKASGCPPEEAKLWYYGLSYGTILGGTYASLFPSRIGRLILDGVGDLEDYLSGGWSTANYDTDRVVRYFYATCFEAGPELCPFSQNASSADELEQRTLAIFEDLRAAPLEIADPELVLAPISFTWQDLSTLIFALSYTPAENFPLIAQALAGLEQRNRTIAAIGDGEITLFTNTLYDSRDVRSQVTCFDSAGRFNLSTIEKYKEHVAHMTGQSFYGGPFISAIIGTVCRSLDTFPPEHQILRKVGADETNAPILWIGNTLDPVTPLKSAKKMAAMFPGSVALQTDTVGHGTFGVESKCTDDYVKAYLADGSLPPPDTICPSEEKPFQKPVEGLTRLVRRSGDFF